MSNPDHHLEVLSWNEMVRNLLENRCKEKISASRKPFHSWRFTNLYLALRGTTAHDSLALSPEKGEPGVRLPDIGTEELLQLQRPFWLRGLYQIQLLLRMCCGFSSGFSES